MKVTGCDLKNFRGLADKILSGILQNVERQKDNLSAAAWLETLVEVLDQAPASAIRQSILPVALTQAEPTKRAQRRIIATKLVEKLSTLLPSMLVRREVMPTVKMLSQDPNANVRSSIAQRLGVIASSLKSVSDCGTLILPCLSELCKDDDVGVREAVLDTIAVCLPHFSKEHRRTSVVPLIRTCTDQAIFLQDETLSTVARNFGQWMSNLKDVMNVRETRWFLDTYLRLTNLSTTSSLSSSAVSVGSYNGVCTIARRMCAYNFPCVLLMFGEDHFEQKLLPVLESFCSDPDEDIRSAIAAGFHEVVKLRPNDPSLIQPFIELIRGSSVEVVSHLTGHLNEVLPNLYKCALDPSNPNKINRAQLDRILIGCNRLIRGTSCWRAHHSYLKNIAVMRHLLPAREIFINFVPMLKQEVLTARAIPCRVAASLSLLLIMRHNPESSARQAVIDFFVHSIAKHRSCHRRRLFIDIAPLVATNFSRSFFIEHFLKPLLRMSSDNVSNIRLHLCKTLPRIKENLILPDDEDILQQMEKIIREMLSAEESILSRQIIQTYACEFAREETKNRQDSNDEAKKLEEDRLWSASNLEAEKASENKLMNAGKSQQGTSEVQNDDKKSIQNGEIRKVDSSMWRIQPRASRTAVVRPQPQVVVTQRSPSPMPRFDRSRLAKSSSQNPRPSPVTSTAISSHTSSMLKNTSTMANDRSSTEATSAITSSVNSDIVKRRPPSGRVPLSSSLNNTKFTPPKTSRLNSTPSVQVPLSSRRSLVSKSDNTPSSTSSLLKSPSLSTSRSSSLSRPTQGLLKVRSFSNIERRPGHMSMRIYTMN